MSATEYDIRAKSESGSPQGAVQSATMTIDELIEHLSLNQNSPVTGLPRSDKAKKYVAYKFRQKFGIKKLPGGVLPRGQVMRALGVN